MEATVIPKQPFLFQIKVQPTRRRHGCELHRLTENTRAEWTVQVTARRSRASRDGERAPGAGGGKHTGAGSPRGRQEQNSAVYSSTNRVWKDILLYEEKFH